MEEQKKENGLVVEENNNKEFRFSWRKLCSWIALVLSVIIPAAGIGLGLISLSSATEEEKKEVTLICYIAMGVGAFFLLGEFVLSIFLL